MATHSPQMYYPHAADAKRSDQSPPAKAKPASLQGEDLFDRKRVLLTNIPKGITYEHLLLYLEYLSDEVGIERVDDAHKDFKNSIIVKFVDNIGKLV